MSSRREQATVALVAYLAAGIPTASVERNRDIPTDFVTEDTPAVVVTDGDDRDVRFLPPNTVEIDAEVKIAGYVTATDYADLGPARDTLELAVWKIVMAHPRLGSDLTWDVQPGATVRSLDLEQSKPVAAFDMPVTLRIKAQADDPAIAA